MARRLISALLFSLLSSAALADTTDNLLPAMSEFEASGGTAVGPATGCPTGAYCTSGTSGGGGTYTSSFDLPLTKEEVQKGFDLTYGATITSHASNAVLSTCTSTMQSGDCRDIFSLTVTLWDGGSVVEKFENEVELNYGGSKNYEWTVSVAANDYGKLTGEFEFYGIDAGYPSGYYGPQISDPYLTATYSPVDLIEQQLIVMDVIDQGATLPSFDSFTPDPPAADNFEIAPIAEPVAPVDQQMEPPPAVSATLGVRAEAADVEMQPEAERAEPETRSEAKVEAKTSSVKYDAAVQQQALIVMAAMADRMPPQPTLEDTPGFFTSETVPDAEIPVDYRRLYQWAGAANAVHDAMMAAQWQR